MNKFRAVLDIFRYDIPFSKKLNRLYIIIFIIPLFLINLSLASHVAGLLEKQLRYAATANYQQTLEYLKAELSYYDTLAFTLSRVDNLQILYQNRRRLAGMSANELSIHKRDLEAAIYTAISRSSVAGFSLYLDGALGILANQSTYFSFDEIRDRKWFSEIDFYFKKHRRSFLLCPPGWLEQDGGKIVSFARTIFSKDNYWELFGLVRVDIHLSVFTAILEKNNSNAGSISYIVNYENEIIALSNGPAAGIVPSPEDFLSYSPVETDAQWRPILINGQEFITRRAPVGKYRINLITLIPTSAIRRDSVMLQIVVFFILAGLSCAAGFFFYREFSTLATRIRLIIRRMQATNQGNLEPITEYAGQDEVGQLIVNYNLMVENLRAFAEYKYQSGMELKNYELQVLQEQINPHFLYNTLEMINWLAKNGLTEKVGAAVDALARFYQAALGGGKNMVPLRNELAHVEAYINLQNMRFEDVLHYRCEYPEEALACLVPRTILQPIVENAILHGILEKVSGEGSILVKVKAEGRVLRICIEDDGVGMDAGEVERLNSGTANDGYGAANVAKRLKLMYGPGGGLFCRSEKGRGTTVTLTLPAETGDGPTVPGPG
jgi:two-component system sensor histidine kinase YesM